MSQKAFCAIHPRVLEHSLSYCCSDHNEGCIYISVYAVSIDVAVKILIGNDRKLKKINCRIKPQS